MVFTGVLASAKRQTEASIMAGGQDPRLIRLLNRINEILGVGVDNVSLIAILNQLKTETEIAIGAGGDFAHLVELLSDINAALNGPGGGGGSGVTTYSELLNAPGNGAIRSFAGFNNMSVSYTINGTINPGGNVAVRLEGRVNPGSDWVPLDQSGNTVKTATGSDGFLWSGTLDAVRFVWVSQTNTSGITISVNARFESFAASDAVIAASGNARLWIGTQAEYDVLPTKDTLTLYVTDDKVYRGSALVSGGGGSTPVAPTNVWLTNTGGYWVTNTGGYFKTN